MVDLNKLMSGLAQSGFASGLAGGMAGGALSGALMSKKGRKVAGNLLKVGGVAAIGGLAWSAYRNYQRSQQGPAAPAQDRWQALTQSRFDVESQPAYEREAQSLLLVRAMITAANSDGHLDSAERDRIYGEVDRLRLGPAEKASLFDELRHPRPVEEIAEAAASPAVAVEVYAASLLAIDETAPHAQDYLERLRELLALPGELVAAVHEQAARPLRAVQAA